MENWKEIEEFPMYAVSDHGNVRNNDSGRMMSLTKNQQGIVQVGLNHKGVHYKRSVTLLVANAFLRDFREEPFDTPINLDGDRTNNHVSNILWRPRWFAYVYHKQFKRWYPHRIMKPVMDMETREISEDSLECCRRYGLLERDLVMSIVNRTFVWPTYQIFRVVTE